MTTRILIADDHPVVLAGIHRALEDVADMEIVGEATKGSRVLPLIARLKPDLVLLDLSMPQMDGLACLDRIRRQHPEVHVVVLSAHSDRQHIEAALRRGATAYLVKGLNPLDLPSALRQAIEGTVFHILGAPLENELSEELEELTRRELEMLRALGRGLSNQAIGKEMWVSEQTVKFHLRNIYRKLGVSNRLEAARFAYEHGLVSAVG
jgi:DNA-binding NarL/FixJ family response regulator